MGERLKVGDYGEISFTIKSKRKYPTKLEDPFIITGFVMMAEVIEADGNNLLVMDNDDQEYIVVRKRVRSFERREKVMPRLVQ